MHLALVPFAEQGGQKGRLSVSIVLKMRSQGLQLSHSLISAMMSSR